MKLKFHLSLVYLALFFSFSVKMIAQSPNWLWAKSIGGTGKYENVTSHSLVVDPGSGDIFVSGEFDGNVDFDPGPESFFLTSNGPQSYFISRLDGSGNFKWTKGLDIKELYEFGGVWYSDLADITVDTLGSRDVYLTGYFSDTTDFDPDEGVYRLIPVGGNDIFISKLDSSGNFLWAKQLGSSGPERSFSIDIDPGGSGNIYISGEFEGTVDFDPGPGTFNLTANSTHHYLSSPFISKLDSDGNFVWAKTFVGLNTGSSGGNQKVVIDLRSGDVYTAGFFEGTLDFDPGPDTSSLTWYSSGQNGIFFSKLDSSGNFVWAKLLENPLGNFVIDPLGSGNIYGLSSIGVYTKLDDSGNIVWTKKIIGTADAYTCRSFAIDPTDGALYTSGHFGGKVDFDPGAFSHSLISVGYSDGFISKLDSTGHFVWVKRMGGMYEDFGVSMVLDASRNIYVTGSFNSPSILFDTTDLTTASNTGLDIFIAKLNSTSFTHGRIYVKQNATGNNDGTSWQNAFTKLQDGLVQADNGDQLWIAAGTYIPEGPSPDSSHFLLKKGVEIYGGFNGTESSLSERKLWTDTTTLSGDILGDDFPTDSDSSTNRLDNAHHVLILDCGGNETIIDGLEFKGGSTRFDHYEPDSTDILGYDRGSGGALYIRNTPAKIRNCLFRDNHGFIGSCIFSRGDSSNSNNLLIANSKFVQNRATFGAGIFLNYSNSADGLHYEIDSCTFDSNISFGGGCGVIYSISNQLLESTGAIRNSEFLYNHEGAVFSYRESLLIENCKFKGNYQLNKYPPQAGGIWGFGSAIYFENYHGNITVRNTKFIDNFNEGYGSAVSIEGGENALFENVLFYRNFGNHSFASSGNIKLLNSTLVDNEEGLGLWLSLNHYAEIQNCIFDNEGDNLSAESWSAGSGIISKGGNISTDSTLASFLKGYNSYADLHQTNPLLGSDFVPLPASPCIDAGNSEGVVSLSDLAGNQRIQGHGIDAGVYESPYMVAVKDAVWDSQVFKVYPNPVLDVLNFELESDWIGDIRLRVYNNQGQPVYNLEMNKSDRIQTFTENLNLLPPGEYIVLAIAGNTTYATKIIFLR